MPQVLLDTFVHLHLPSPLHLAQVVATFVVTTALVGCASTEVSLQPSPQAPVCSPASSALVLWAPHWRPNQKDVTAREQAALKGLNDFFASSGCFATTELRKVSSLEPSAVSGYFKQKDGFRSIVVGIEVRELGPVVKLLSSAALVEGGTEVILRVAQYTPNSGNELRAFIVHWRNGGAGVVKGTDSLHGDVQEALRAALQPSSAAR